MRSTRQKTSVKALLDTASHAEPGLTFQVFKLCNHEFKCMKVKEALVTLLKRHDCPEGEHDVVVVPNPSNPHDVTLLLSRDRQGENPDEATVVFLYQKACIVQLILQI